MIRALVWSGFAIAACGRSSGMSDEQLGNLVVEPKRSDSKIDIDRASRDTDELGRALTRPYEKVLADAGPHTITIKTQTTVEEAKKQVSDLSDEATLEIGDAGFRGVYNNSADYGRETIFIGGKLYLRPRYQRWHGRLPESATEPAEIRETYYGAIPATWDLVGYAAELTDRGVAQTAGKSGRKIEVKLSPSGSKAPREALAQKKWREGRSVEALSGHVILDADSGVPLAIELSASIGFSRDGRSFVMKTKLSSTMTPGKVAIAAPAETEVVATPSRQREVDDRDYLLQGIAPPIRKNPDGTAVAPQPAPPPSGKSDAPPSPARPDDKSKASSKSDAPPSTKPDDKAKAPAKSDAPPSTKSDDKSKSSSDKADKAGSAK